ncbi:nitrite reductase small subunit [Saccharomonospora sp. CUA-673]|uniref:nitrite reductase small subunit NirD n=1 Tax=Saccharomonospora sp. CUA-673 TaxID=1904969 RepID=UPI0009620F4C|nr:nitrite reductase small subunit NirD [Saccharomonospora sp. CUA-673]OLT48188.1 nitrite reductase small subunit [Saccharomonospora sp. CUA-673]
MTILSANNTETAGEAVTWTAVCETSRIPRAFGVAALLDGDVQVAVFRTDDDEYFGLSNMDPFSGAAVLSRGIVGDIGGAPVVASPVYKQNFDLRTGSCLDDETVRIDVYPVRVVEGVVEVGVAEVRVR